MAAKNGLTKVKYKLWITLNFLVHVLGSKNLNIEVKISLMSAEFIWCLRPNIDIDLLLCYGCLFVDTDFKGSGYSP